MHRVEVDIRTGEQIEIAQVAYRNEQGDTLVLDKAQEPPSGFTAFDPLEEQQVQK